MELTEYLKKYPKTAIAFSGGVDSAYLLHAAHKAGADICAYYVKTAFQPQFELDDALRLSEELHIPMKVLHTDVLAHERIAENPCDRCYYCKKMIFAGIQKAAGEDGFTVLMDGTNASDDKNDRPGMRATQELSVKSPLRECGLTKDMVRKLSKEAGLFTWDKPAYACLATRIPTGEIITEEKLKVTEAAEDYLFSLGFTDFRVRMTEGTAKLQVRKEQLEKLMDSRTQIVTELKKYYTSVLLDLETR